MSLEDLKIEPVGKTETESLRTISIETFTETFANQNTESDIQKYVSENLSLKQLSKELNSKDSEFYFLKLNEEIVGYLKLNKGESQTEIKNKNSIEIERIYVKQEFHGKQFGKFLLQKAIDIAKNYAFQYIWLAVWERNLKAIAFYTKHGFVEFDKHTFLLGNDAQIDIMMKLELN